MIGHMNQMQIVDALAWTWLSLAGLSTLYVAWDQFRHNPEAPVMKWGWVLVTLYMGPIALALYIMSDKEPHPGTHEAFIKPLWKQGVGSTVHCVAGDATGIILAAAVTAMIGFPMWIDLIVEYVAGFAFGLFIFQALFMKDMMGGTYAGALRRSFIPEGLSMNLMMAGMAPTMIFLMMGRDMRAMEPSEPLFWTVMSLGVVVGFAVAYPVNVWMVSRNLKHGLMTVRSRPNPAGAHEGGHHGGEAHAKANGVAPDVTRPQLAAISLLTVLALGASFVIPATQVNLTLSAREVGGAVMPPGMIMKRDTPGEAMRDMAAVDPRRVTYEAPVEARGDRILEPRLESGVKVFDLEASVIRWNILPYKQVAAYALNRQVPGPRLRVVEGDRIRINVRNRLPESTAFHWHGLIVPNAMDGPADITQEPIRPGETFTYEFTVRQSGTYFYHTHDHPDRQQTLGLYGALIIDPREKRTNPGYDLEHTIQLQEWLEREGLTYPAMLMEGGLPNFFTINGKAYPSTETIRMKVGQRVLLRFIGTHNNFIHPMHVHGGPFRIVAIDGIPVQPSAQIERDTVNVGPGQRYDVVWTADEPGRWLLHCHIPHHTVNNNVEEQGGGGLTMIIEVSR